MANSRQPARYRRSASVQSAGGVPAWGHKLTWPCPHCTMPTHRHRVKDYDGNTDYTPNATPDPTAPFTDQDADPAALWVALVPGDFPARFFADMEIYHLSSGIAWPGQHHRDYGTARAPPAPMAARSPRTPSLRTSATSPTRRTGPRPTASWFPRDMTALPDDAAGTVTLSTPRPYSFILQVTRYLFIVCGSGLKDRRLLAQGTSGSGPFQLTSAEPDQSYTYTRRKDYTWGPAGVPVADRPSKVVLRVLPGEGTIVNALLSRQLNGAVLGGPDRARVMNVPGLTATDQQNGTDEFFFHEGPGHPGSDPAVRKALLAAVNLTDLGAVVTSGTGRLPTGLVTQPRPCPGDAVTGHLPGYDPHAAARQLDAAGWTRPSPDAIRVKDGRKLTIRFIYSSSGGETMAAAAEYLADAWKQVGVEVRLQAVSDAAYFQVEDIEQNWDLNWAPLGVTLPSQLTGLLSGPFTPDGNNFAHLRNTAYDRLTAQAATLPVAAGCPLWNKAETALFDNADLIPVVDKTQTVAAYGATFRISSGMFSPTAIRMTGGSR